MTTNIDRAAEVIAESITRDSAPAHEIVADLEHEGLIMPDLLDGATPGPWHAVEYRAEFWENLGPGMDPWRPVSRDMDTQGWTDKDTAHDDRERAHADGLKTRLVRRLVGPVEVIDGE